MWEGWEGNNKTKGWETDQSVTCLKKHEGLSLDPQKPHKRQGEAVCAGNPRAVRWEAETGGALEVHMPGSLASWAKQDVRPTRGSLSA